MHTHSRLTGSLGCELTSSKNIILFCGRADSSTEITARPQPTEKEIRFILDAISEYLQLEVRRSDVQSAWSGLRPLAMDPNAADTASASRDHIVTQDPDGLITVTGETLSMLAAAVMQASLSTWSRPKSVPAKDVSPRRYG